MVQCSDINDLAAANLAGYVVVYGLGATVGPVGYGALADRFGASRASAVRFSAQAALLIIRTSRNATPSSLIDLAGA